jgi:4-aminobutyrate aminotransferase-like enzyme
VTLFVTDVEDLLQRRSAVLGNAYRLFYDDPVHFVRGEGVRLYDAQGNAYLDAYNNVPSVGHSHPRVAAAVASQVATLNTHTRYLTSGLISYAERLVATHAPGLDRAMFTCTGSEANDLALRVARHHTGGTGVIVTENAYHGVTASIAEVSPSLGLPLGPDVRVVPAPWPGAGFAAAVAEAIADLRRHGVRLAAFLADSVFSSDGVLPDPVIRPVLDVVHEAGGLYIADEVQSGFGRLGSHMWGYQRHGLAPDIAVMGKPMGNGLPIAGIVARRAVLEDFGRTARYFNTFGGNPVCVAAATAVLDVIESEDLQANSATVGAYLADALTRLAATSPALADVRGAGLYVGVDVVDPATGEPSAPLASSIVNGLRRRRVLISATGPRNHTLKIRPPLPFSAGHADELTAALSTVLADLPLPRSDLLQERGEVRADAFGLFPDGERLRQPAPGRRLLDAAYVERTGQVRADADADAVVPLAPPGRRHQRDAGARMSGQAQRAHTGPTAGRAVSGSRHAAEDDTDQTAAGLGDHAATI